MVEILSAEYGIITVNDNFGNGDWKKVKKCPAYFPEYEEILMIQHQTRLHSEHDYVTEVGMWTVSRLLKMPYEIGIDKDLIYCDKVIYVATTLQEDEWFVDCDEGDWDYAFLTHFNEDEDSIRVVGWITSMAFKKVCKPLAVTSRRTEAGWEISPKFFNPSVTAFDTDVMESLE
jgi:hypothetical protein